MRTECLPLISGSGQQCSPPQFDGAITKASRPRSSSVDLANALSRISMPPKPNATEIAPQIKSEKTTLLAFCTDWENIAELDLLSPRTKLGAELTRVFESQFLTPLYSRPFTRERLLDLLAAIQQVPAGTQIRSKLHTLTDAHIQCAEFDWRARQSSNTWLSRMHSPGANGWKLVLDAQSHSRGIFAFEEERGYVAAMMRALNFMIDTVDAPLNAAMLELLHDTAVSGTYKLREKASPLAKIPLGYRHCIGVGFGLFSTATPAGLAEFQASEKPSQTWIRITETPRGKFVHAAAKSALECRGKANDIFNHYAKALRRVQAINVADTREQEELRCIAQCCQDLEQHHLFRDGNIRTVVFLCMNKLLLQNGYSPALWNDPNCIDMHSVSEIVSLIRRGQKAYQKLIE